MSATIALMDKSVEGDCILQKEFIGEKVLDQVDWIYYKLLLQGFTEQQFREDILIVLVGYVGYLYGLVMFCESKTYLSVIRKRNTNLPPKQSTIHYALISNLRASATSFTPKLRKKNRSISKLCTINEGMESPLFSIKDCIVKPSKARQHNDKKLMTQLNKNNPYKSKYLKQIQGLICIGSLTDVALSCIKEDISHLFYYMLNIHAIQLHKTKKNIKVFNYNFHDKCTNDILYGIALRCDYRGYKWRMMDKLFTAAEILNNHEWHLTKSCLPKFTNTLLDNNNVKYRIQTSLMDTKTFRYIIAETKWCKIKVYHGIVNKNNQIVWKLTQEQFKLQVVQFYAHNMSENYGINLIPILIMNDAPHIEYMFIVRMQTWKRSIPVDIGISFIYDEHNANKVRVASIHVDTIYIINQHELVNPSCNCTDLASFNSVIDSLQIGNPDDMQNKINAKDKIIRQLKEQANFSKK